MKAVIRQSFGYVSAHPIAELPIFNRHNESVHDRINERIDIVVHGNFAGRKDLRSCSESLMYWSDCERWKNYVND